MTFNYDSYITFIHLHGENKFHHFFYTTSHKAETATLLEGAASCLYSAFTSGLKDAHGQEGKSWD
jgi:hypothetical protein